MLNFIALFKSEDRLKESLDKKLEWLDKWLRRTVPELEKELYRVNQDL